mgnify:CR=1 FL=1|jgi:hypothetical protein
MKCKVVIPVNGVKRNRDGSIALKKRFKANAEVDGKFIRHGLLPENQVVLFVTRDGYLIPPHCLMEIKNMKESYDDIQEAKEVKEESYLDKEKVKKIKDSGVLDIKSMISNSEIASKHMIQGAIGGGLIMLVFAMYKGKSKLLFAAIGAIGGGVLGKLYNKHIK